MIAVAEKDQEVQVKRKTDRDAKRKVELKRYNLALPMSVFDEVQELADEEGTSVLELLKRFIKIGLILSKLSHLPNTNLIVREGDKETKLVLL